MINTEDIQNVIKSVNRIIGEFIESINYAVRQISKRIHEIFRGIGSWDNSVMTIPVFGLEARFCIPETMGIIRKGFPGKQKVCVSVLHGERISWYTSGFL